MWSREDSKIEKAKEDILKLLDDHKKQVFYSRQIEVILEQSYYHWITNAALRQLTDDGKINFEKCNIVTGKINCYWHKSYRYYKNDMKKLVDNVNYFSDAEFTRGLGSHAELLVSDALFRAGFTFVANNSNSYKGVTWNNSEHDLDFIVEKNNMAFGIEVKNKLSYIDQEEFNLKIRLCKHLGIIPIFACRMLPGNWINDLYKLGGFSWILKYQLYSKNEQKKALEIKKSMMLSVDSPERLYQGTINRLNNYIQRKSKILIKNIAIYHRML